MESISIFIDRSKKFMGSLMKSNLFIAEYFQYQGCLNIEQGVNLWHLLNQVLLLGVPGDVVELGSLTGTTAAVIQKTLTDFGSAKRLFLYDSFEGLPIPGPEDGNCPLVPENFKTQTKHTIDRFEKFGLPMPTIVPGWFEDTLPKGLPKQIAFAHLDGDLYGSTLVCLQEVYPRLAPGAVVLVDDYADTELCKEISAAYEANVYCRNAQAKCNISNWLPGVQRACEEYLADRPEEMTVLLAGVERHAYFRKA